MTPLEGFHLKWWSVALGSRGACTVRIWGQWSRSAYPGQPYEGISLNSRWALTIRLFWGAGQMMIPLAVWPSSANLWAAYCPLLRWCCQSIPECRKLKHLGRIFQGIGYTFQGNLVVKNFPCFLNKIKNWLVPTGFEQFWQTADLDGMAPRKRRRQPCGGFDFNNPYRGWGWVAIRAKSRWIFSRIGRRI